LRQRLLQEVIDDGQYFLLHRRITDSQFFLSRAFQPPRDDHHKIVPQPQRILNALECFKRPGRQVMAAFFGHLDGVAQLLESDAQAMNVAVRLPRGARLCLLDQRVKLKMNRLREQ